MSILSQRVAAWHRPMILFAAGMAGMAVLSVGGLVWDDRILLGAPIWQKPFKFAVSFVFYGLSWAWMVSLLTRGRRLADWLSTGVVLMLLVEYAVMIIQVVRGRPSHFNVATPFDQALWAVMSGTIAVFWVCTLVLTAVLFRSPVADPADRWAVRLAAVISLVGLALGVLMVGPTPEQPRSVEDGTFQGMIGAHSVGVEDGGPGMPITGWSLTGGDLRIPHFVGIHALQALPLLAMLLKLLARRVPRLRDATVRLRLVLIGAAGYTGLVGLVTWQALRGQPLVRPDGLTLAAAVVLVTGVLVAAAVALTTSNRDSGNSRTKREPELVSLR